MVSYLLSHPYLGVAAFPFLSSGSGWGFLLGLNSTSTLPVPIFCRRRAPGQWDRHFGVGILLETSRFSYGAGGGHHATGEGIRVRSSKGNLPDFKDGQRTAPSHWAGNLSRSTGCFFEFLFDFCRFSKFICLRRGGREPDDEKKSVKTAWGPL